MDTHYDDNLTRHTTHVSQKIVSDLDLTMKIESQKNRLERFLPRVRGRGKHFSKKMALGA